MPRNERRFTALLTKDDDEKLKALCLQNKDSKGATIRRCIRALYAMEVLMEPTCASGIKCYVPHMHRGLQAPLIVPPPAPQQ
jgi:hypothetical protein